ncbi:MAG: acetyl-CoA carboxylase biotin carboxyl carrier protein [Acidobacteriota bacterium]
MNAKELRELLDYLGSSSFTELELEQEGFKLRLRRQGMAMAPAVTLAKQDADPAVQAQVVPMSPVPAPAAAPSDDGMEAITSPMVGTFYRAPSPNADAFVEVGDTVQPGQVVCIVEAMKLMNEIEADRAGEIVEIPVANGQPVEFGETLFRIRPL